MEHCTPHTRAVHTATCLERKVVGSSQPPAAESMSPRSKGKLPPPAYQARLGLLSVVCRLRGMLFPGTVCTCNQGPLSNAWAHCISYVPSAYSLCRRCCCCPLQCDRQRMGTRLNSAGDPAPYYISWSLSFLHLLLALPPPLLLSRSRAFWHIPPAIQLW